MNILDFLILVGLIVDLVGAIFLIGPSVTIADFPIMGWVGAKIWPELRNARNGLYSLKRNRKLTPENEGFSSLSKVYQENERRMFDNLPHAEGEPKKFEVYTTDDGYKIRFIFDGGTHHNENFERLKNILDERIDGKFRTTGAWLLIIGYLFQIVAVTFKLF